MSDALEETPQCEMINRDAGLDRASASTALKLPDWTLRKRLFSDSYFGLTRRNGAFLLARGDQMFSC